MSSVLSGDTQWRLRAGCRDQRGDLAIYAANVPLITGVAISQPEKTMGNHPVQHLYIYIYLFIYYEDL